jgi:hypothetical protein
MRWRSDFSVHPEVVAGAKTFRSTAELPFPNLAWSIGRDLPNFEFRITRPPVLGGSEWTMERQRITYLPFALSLALEFHSKSNV